MPTSKITVNRLPDLIVTSDYVEGHVCTADEAEVLHRAKCKAIANNFAPHLRAMRRHKATEDEMRSKFASIAQRYTFEGKYADRAPTPADPILTEARTIARAKIKEKLRAKGGSPLSISEMDAKIAEVLERNPHILLEAKRRVTALQDVAMEALDLGL